MSTRLIIGGPHDGERTAVPDDMDRIELMVAANEQTAAYNKVRLVDAWDRLHEVFVFTGEDIDPIAALIAGYRKP